MLILGIETSCDETSAAIIQADPNQSLVQLRASITPSSLYLHAKTGGIIPEIAAREQIKFIIPVIQQTLKDANIQFIQHPNSNIPTPAIDTIAVTTGPGLVGSLLVGVETAKALSVAWNIPVIPVNHLFGHIYANWISTDQRPKAKDQKPIPFPALALVVSGGHTDLVFIENHEKFTWLGGTRDDAAGECFDKCARLLGYQYPGGPKIAELAKNGNPKAFNFPRPMIATKDFDFSFSGLKTAFLNTTKQLFPISQTFTHNSKAIWQQVLLEKHLSQSEKQTLYDLCASLQQAIIDVIVKKALIAAKKYNAKSILVSGGVSANNTLREKFQERISEEIPSVKFFAPDKSLSTDNAAMIAAAAFYKPEKVQLDKITANPELYFD